MRWNKSGFTIVELLIVIVVIAILAAITIVVFSGIRQRANDSQRKSDLSQVAKALRLYKVDKGNLIGAGSGCGKEGNGQGWLSHRSSMGGINDYPRSVLDCLKDENLIQKDIIDPSGCTDDIRISACNAPPTHAYMKINCTSSGGTMYTYLMAHLETNTTLTKPSTMDAECSNVDWFDTLGINYIVRVD